MPKRTVPVHQPNAEDIELLAELVRDIGDAIARWAERATPPEPDPATLAPVIHLEARKAAAA